MISPIAGRIPGTLAQAGTPIEKKNCGWSSNAYLMNTGVVRCESIGGHARILWNRYWILDIFALEGGRLPAQELADKVVRAVMTSAMEQEQGCREGDPGDQQPGGVVGEIVGISGRIGVSPLNDDWKADPATGGGPLLYVGSHLIDQIL